MLHEKLSGLILLEGVICDTWLNWQEVEYLGISRMSRLIDWQDQTLNCSDPQLLGPSTTWTLNYSDPELLGPSTARTLNYLPTVGLHTK